ncbi:MAG: ECF transporter S component [Actinomycetia bacterium]|nr:ECF transporter S component [Actinomycetes bacterium]
MSASTIRKLVLIGVFTALAYVVTFLIRIPVFGFLTLDPKDAVIGIAGFLLGPVAVVVIAVIVSALEMMISATGPIGFVMNVASTLAFVGLATVIYRQAPSFKRALIGLLVGAVSVTVVMLILNYLLTPIYMGVPRADVAAMLIPVLLPFNLIKSFVSGVLVLLLYQPVMRAYESIGSRQQKR